MAIFCVDYNIRGTVYVDVPAKEDAEEAAESVVNEEIANFSWDTVVVEVNSPGMVESEWIDSPPYFGEGDKTIREILNA